MGIVIGFHSAASGIRKPKTRGSTWPKGKRRGERRRKYSAGIDPRRFHSETACGRIPSDRASELVPPSAVTTSLTELNMAHSRPRFMDLSTVHETSVERPRGSGENARMADPQETVGARAYAIRMRLGGDATQTEFGERFGVGKTTWAAWEKGQNMLDINVADRLAMEFGLTLDWIYAGRGRGLDPGILRDLNRLAETRIVAERKRA